MEEIFPLIIFIIVIALKGLSSIAQRKMTPPSPEKDQAPPKKKASPLEEFLQEIAAKVEPKPRELPEWPEEIERPDYVQEMREYELGKPLTAHRRPLKEELIESAPPPPPSMPEMQMKIREEIKIPRSLKPTSFKISVKGMYIPGMNFPNSGQAPILRSATGKTTFDFNNRKQAKRALIAQMVFSQPRAYETSFDNTIAP
ncbi:MAG: hypothetical protein JXR23_05105 [Pontiellaceae bacterium]|nr:hypothetical protein [Pontiellaceae bacterium]